MALVVTFGLLLVGLGVAVYFLVRLFGAGTEVHNAVDSGSLSVAKQAAVMPSVKILGNTPLEKAFQGLVNPQTSSVDLLNYNRLVAQAMLVSMNAVADGNPAGIQNAKDAIEFVEGPRNSIGDQLTKLLKNPDTKVSGKEWVKTYFDQAALKNPLGLSSNTSNITWDKTEFKVGYLGQDLAKDSGSTNILVKGNGFDMTTMLPYTNYANGTKISVPGNAIDSTGTLLRGYQRLAINHGGNELTVYAMSISPEQPHLVNREKFLKQTTQPGLGDKNPVIIPPNTFVSGANVFDKDARSTVAATAAATVGTASFKDSPYPFSIPDGYLIIDNSGIATYSGTLPNPDNVAANELGTGIQVDPNSGCFSDNGAVEAWEKYNASLKAGSGGPPPGPAPSLDGLYTNSGRTATAVDAARIGGGPAVTCNDLNSDAQNATACPTCVQHMTPAPGQKLGPFDLAYHPNGGYSVPGTGDQFLTSGENAKMELMRIYGSGDFYTPATYSLQNDPTGMRLYPNYNNPMNGTLTPWGPPGAGFNQHQYGPAASYSDPHVPGKVTSDGSLLELIRQVTENGEYFNNKTKVTTLPLAGKRPADELERFIKNRIHQMNPKVSDEEINAKVFSQKLKLGLKYYVYVKRDGSVEMSDTAPLTVGAMGSHGVNPDGTAHPFSKVFSLLNTMVNPNYEFNIHDAAFTGNGSGVCSANPSIMETLTVTYTPSSGAYNLLGVIKLQDNATSNNPVFCERD